MSERMVPVTTVGKATSAIVFVLMAFSLLNGWATGFHLVYPAMAALVACMAAGFYGISILLRREIAADDRAEADTPRTQPHTETPNE